MSKFKRVLENEVALLAAMNHPAVVKLYEYNLQGELVVKPCGKCTQVYFIVLEFVEYGDLFSLIEQRGEFSERVARFFFKQLLEGVTYLHETAGVAHRDLKPENLLLNSNL